MMPASAIEQIDALLGAASRTTDDSARTIYVAQARTELAKLRDDVAQRELLLAGAEAELARKGSP